MYIYTTNQPPNTPPIGLERTVRRINALGRLRGLVPGKGRKAVAGIMMEALQGEGGIRPGTKARCFAMLLYVDTYVYKLSTAARPTG